MARYMALLGHIQPLYSLCFQSPGQNLCCSLVSRTVRWPTILFSFQTATADASTKLSGSLLSSRISLRTGLQISLYAWYPQMYESNSATSSSSMTWDAIMRSQYSTTRSIHYATPCDHAPLFVIRGLLQCTSISSCKSSCPLSEVKRCPRLGSVYISYIGRSAGAKARRPLDGGVRYLECPL